MNLLHLIFHIKCNMKYQIGTHKVQQNYPQLISNKIYIPKQIEKLNNKKVVKIITDITNKKDDDIQRELTTQLINLTNDESKNQELKYISSIYERTKTGRIGYLQSRIATMPNLIHFLDSILLMHVISKCKTNKIPIIPVHDCFYSKEDDIDTIKKFYIEAYIKYILTYNPIDKLIDSFKEVTEKLRKESFILQSQDNKLYLIAILCNELITINDPKITTKYVIYNKDDIDNKVNELILFEISQKDDDNQTEQSFEILTLIKYIRHIIKSKNKCLKTFATLNSKGTDIEKEIIKILTRNQQKCKYIESYLNMIEIRKNKTLIQETLNKIQNSKFILC